mmetsp:Transcript_26154/g.42244  ORF Transcript_26154/g.42244 Transcript_26154/m.42244 type:complete len:379 (+) Transcript_26154:93-1229(+)
MSTAKSAPTYGSINGLKSERTTEAFSEENSNRSSRVLHLKTKRGKILAATVVGLLTFFCVSSSLGGSQTSNPEPQLLAVSEPKAEGYGRRLDSSIFFKGGTGATAPTPAPTRMPTVHRVDTNATITPPATTQHHKDAAKKPIKHHKKEHPKKVQEAAAPESKTPTPANGAASPGTPPAQVPPAAPAAPVDPTVPTPPPTPVPTLPPTIPPPSYLSSVLTFKAGDPLSPTSPPSPKPTKVPTNAPTPKPTMPPTQKPTKPPTNAPTRKPTMPPTDKPTPGPPTPAPTFVPTILVPGLAPLPTRPVPTKAKQQHQKTNNLRTTKEAFPNNVRSDEDVVLEDNLSSVLFWKNSPPKHEIASTHGRTHHHSSNGSKSGKNLS